MKQVKLYDNESVYKSRRMLSTSEAFNRSIFSSEKYFARKYAHQLELHALPPPRAVAMVV